MSKERVTLLLLAAIAVASILRLVWLDRKSLWLDEVVTLQMARTSISDILNARWDPHPPLYYVLMHYWINLGESEFLLRLPSALAGILAIPLLYWLVREWSGDWAAIASAWLLALAPLHIWYSQEARMYALACTLGLASTLVYTWAIRRNKQWLAWPVWVAVMGIGLYTSYSHLLLLGAQMILFVPLWQSSKAHPRTLFIALVAVVCVLLMFAPQAQTFMSQLVFRGGQVWYYIPLQWLLTDLGITVSSSYLNAALISGGLAFLGATSIIVWKLSSRLQQIRTGWGWLLAVVILYVAILVASAVVRGLGLKRQTLILFPYLLSGIVVIAAMHRYRMRILMGLLLITVPFTSYTLVAQEQEDWRSVARVVEESAEQRDIILLNPSYIQLSFDYYYRGQVPRQGVGPSDVPKNLLPLVTSYERVWLVLAHDRYTDPQETVRRWLDEHCALLGEQVFAGVRVRVYNSK